MQECKVVQSFENTKVVDSYVLWQYNVYVHLISSHQCTVLKKLNNRQYLM